MSCGGKGGLHVMSSFKPRKVDAPGFFVNDHREEEKFWYLDPVVQPVVHVRSDGTFEDPDARVVVPSRFVVGREFADGIVGNAGYVVGVAGQTWEIRALSYTSVAGGNFGMEDDAVLIGTIIAIGAGATGQLIDVGPIPVAGGSAITINSGAIADQWNMRAVRLL